MEDWRGLILERAVADREISAPVEPATSAGEPIKLVIWDLDETFWQGTLSEGGIMPIPAHIDLVKALSARGIINSICSKNDFVAAQQELMRLGVWEHFVFPRIAFAPKGAMIAEIVEATQLRAPSVLFIDDNVMNLNEASHYNTGLQLAQPDVLPGLLDDPRCTGKADTALERLARYKVLEQKQVDQGKSEGDNTEFLRSSNIRISLHYDVLEQFPRIHDLVNRTNQLNFTKRRWPEDADAALKVAQDDFNAVFNSHCGYVKVADRYGNYGICGFFMTRFNRALHFLFSCRAMNMGVEQFVWHIVGKPEIVARGEVSSTLGSLPDWITVVDDADSDDVAVTQPGIVQPSLCLRGACDLSMMAHYLRVSFKTIEEYQYPYQGWVIHRTAREIAVAEEVKTQAIQALLAHLPGAPPHRFESAVNTGAADVYVLSFSSEIFGGLKRSRSTGVILPLFLAGVGAKPYGDFSYEQLREKQEQVHLTAEDWAYLQQEYESVPFLDAQVLTADLHCLFKKLVGKLVIVLKLNCTVGNRKWNLDNYRRINEIVVPVAQEYGCKIVDMAEFVHTTDDLIDPEDPGVHYSRNVYRQLATRVTELVTAHQQLGTNTAVAPSSMVATPMPAVPVLAPPAVAAMQAAPGPKRPWGGETFSEKGLGNIIDIDETAKVNVQIRVHGNHNRLVIGKNVRVDGTILDIVGNNCSIVLNDDVLWRGIIRCRHDNSHVTIGRKTTSMHAIVTLHEAGCITIGEDCMISGDVRMDVSDMHSIMDRTTGQRVNKAKNIAIGDHVWLGHGVTVSKGCQIGNGSVVGTKSLAMGYIPENVVVAGVPAKIIRENVEWSRKRL
jgi:FkbH-like protein